MNNSSNGQINKRLSIIVEEICGGNVSKFAEKTGVNAKTLHTYIKGRSPNTDALFSICRRYNVNLNWLVAGIGPKYITDQGDAMVLDPDPEIADLMEGARKVLTSGNPIAFDALERNIRYFSLAVDAEKRADSAEKRMQEMEKRLRLIEREIKNKSRSTEAQSSNKKVA